MSNRVGGNGEVKRSQVPRAPDSVPLATWPQVRAYPGRPGGV